MNKPAPVAPAILTIAPALQKHEARVVQVALLHMMSCTLSLVEKANRDGTGDPVEVNPSIKEAVDNAVKPLLHGLDDFTISMIAKRAAKVGDATLARVDAANELSRCLGVAYAIGVMVERKLVSSESTIAAVVMGIVEESDDDADEVWQHAKKPKEVAKQVVKAFYEELTKP